MLALKYVTRILALAFRDFFNWSGLINGLVSVVLALYAGPKAPVSSLSTYDLALYVAYALGFFLAIRIFLVAPYLAWRGAYSRAEELQREVEKPAHLEHQELAKLRAHKKMELIASIREAHICVVKGDQEGWSKELRVFTHLTPQAIASTRIHDRLTAFVHAADDCLKKTEKGDYTLLKDRCEDVIYAIHNE